MSLVSGIQHAVCYPGYVLAEPVMADLRHGRVESATPYVVTRWRRTGGPSAEQQAYLYPLGLAFFVSLLAFFLGWRSVVWTPWGPAPLAIVAFVAYAGAAVVTIPFIEERDLVTVGELTPLGAFRVAALGAEYGVGVAA